MRIFSPRLPSALSDCVVPLSSNASASSQSSVFSSGRRLLSFSADDTVKLLYRFDYPASIAHHTTSNTATSSINMSKITQGYKAVSKWGDGEGEILSIMPNERCTAMSVICRGEVLPQTDIKSCRYALNSGGSLIELKVVGGDRQW
jgi:hypothetical protein